MDGTPHNAQRPEIPEGYKDVEHNLPGLDPGAGGCRATAQMSGFTDNLTVHLHLTVVS
jgi:hypothetical protein